MSTNLSKEFDRTLDSMIRQVKSLGKKKRECLLIEAVRNRLSQFEKSYEHDISLAVMNLMNRDKYIRVLKKLNTIKK